MLGTLGPIESCLQEKREYFLIIIAKKNILKNSPALIGRTFKKGGRHYMFFKLGLREKKEEKQIPKLFTLSKERNKESWKTKQKITK